MSTCTTERSFGGMTTEKPPFRRPMIEEKLSYIVAILHIDRYIDIRIDQCHIVSVDMMSTLTMWLACRIFPPERETARLFLVIILLTSLLNLLLLFCTC